MTTMTFQEIILKLQNYWADYGCVIWQPYDLEKGAGTLILRHFSGRLVLNPGNALMENPLDGQPTADTAKILTGYSITTSSRW